MRRLLVTALLTLLPSAAVADARHDITELRHGRAASSQRFLGWTDDGRAVARRLVCGEGGELACQATVDVHAPGSEPEQIELWHNTESLYDAATPDNPKGPISAAEATAFIRAEARALERLGPLDRGTPAADPRGVFGPVGGEPTSVYLRTSTRGGDDERLVLHLAVRGPRGASVDLRRLDAEPWRVDSQRVLDARRSPDGETVWVALHYTDGVMCWDGEDIALAAADRPRVRARLANAAGLRAYRAEERDEALARFEEATAEDPTYAWGWFNRGSLQSRRGELDAALQSLRHAIELDPTLAARACMDDDYAPLDATPTGAALMDCDDRQGR